MGPGAHAHVSFKVYTYDHRLVSLTLLGKSVFSLN